MQRTAFRAPILIFLALALASPSAISADRLQRSVSVAEAFVPVALLVIQGTDTPFEYGVFAGSVALQALPNALMLFGEATGRADLTRFTRWVNFGIGSALAGGLFGVGIAYLAGALGPQADSRSRGACYLALSIPAGVAALVDLLPYSVEASTTARTAREPDAP